MMKFKRMTSVMNLKWTIWMMNSKINLNGRVGWCFILDCS